MDIVVALHTHTMNKIILALFCLLGINIALADVEYAFVAKAEEISVYERSHEDTADYSRAFEGIDIWRDGEETEDGVFGEPVYMVVKSNNRCYLIIINNVHGVFGVYPVIEQGEQWISGEEEGRDIYLPGLYEKLQKLGLKVLSVEELNKRRHCP